MIIQKFYRCSVIVGLHARWKELNQRVEERHMLKFISAATESIRD